MKHNTMKLGSGVTLGLSEVGNLRQHLASILSENQTIVYYFRKISLHFSTALIFPFSTVFPRFQGGKCRRGQDF